jgi:hypothetical protein
MGQKRKRGDSSERHYIERGKQSLAIKVPGQCPLVPLLNVRWRGGKAFGSGERRVIRTGAMRGSYCILSNFLSLTLTLGGRHLVIQITFTNTFLTSEITQHVSIMKKYWSIPFEEIIVVYFEYHTTSIHSVDKLQIYWMLKQVVRTYSKLLCFKGLRKVVTENKNSWHWRWVTVYQKFQHVTCDYYR